MRHISNMAYLNLLSLNVKSLNSPFKRKALWNDPLKFGSDILCIQESHFLRDNSPHFAHPKFPHIFSSHNTKKKGVLTIIKDSISSKLIARGDMSSWLQRLKTQYWRSPTSHNNSSKILKITKKIQKGNIILCGDFNATMDPLLDSTKGTQSKRKGMKDILSQEDLHDPWRCLYSYTHMFLSPILGSIYSSLTERAYRKSQTPVYII